MIPTTRALLFLLITAPLLALGAWLPFMEWIAWGYAIFVLAMMYFDWRLAGDIGQFDLMRAHDTNLSLGAEKPIRLSIRNLTRRAVSCPVRDEPPEMFKIGRRTMERQLLGRGTWESVDDVRPLRRAGFEFVVFTLPGFQIARRATDRSDLQLRMQGNAFLGAFFRVSPLLEEFGISRQQFEEVVHKQYVKKFGRLGESVVKSNMEVMTQGFDLVREIAVGELTAADRSTLRGKPLLPLVAGDAERGNCGCRAAAPPELQAERTPLTRAASFDAEFRASYGYNQPANAYSALGVMAAGSGDTASKYVARRETPLYIPENCTQCMECIAVCPDTALPNCSQDLGTVLRTAVGNYVTDASERTKMLQLVPEIESRTRGCAPPSQKGLTANSRAVQ